MQKTQVMIAPEEEQGLAPTEPASPHQPNPTPRLSTEHTARVGARCQAAGAILTAMISQLLRD